MMMHNPPHVGEVLRELFLEPLDITVTHAASALGVSRQALSNLIHEKTGISADMAIRLSKAFDNSPEFWMNLQKQYDLWQAMKHEKDIKVTSLAHAA